MLRLLLLLGLACSALAGNVSYDNYKVFRIVPTSEEQLLALKELKNYDLGESEFSFWSEPNKVNSAVDVLVAPTQFDQFADFMKIYEMKYEPFIENVQELINLETPVIRTEGFDWTQYHSLDEIYAYLDTLAEKYPSNVQVVAGGHTYQGREIKGVKVSFGNESNPGIFLEGGIHAREWISSATVTYILNELLTSKDPKVRELADRHDWYIFPVFNPDGFAYTKNFDRMWRKSIKPYSKFCKGSDLNRNWDFEWMVAGSSSHPCDETFAGSEPFSDIETKSMSEYLKSISDKFYAYFSFHAYSQLLMFPYGHTSEHIENYDEYLAIGKKTIDGLSKRYGTYYVTGSISETIYPASGSSLDWVKGNFNTSLVYVYELRDRGRYGFLLPPDQIIPTGEETLDSLVALFEEAAIRGYPKNGN